MKKAFVVLAAALSMSGAFAQTAASSAQPSSAAVEAHAAQHEQRVEERINYLHSALKITPDQESLWKTFADQMRSNGQTMADLYKQRAEGENTRNALDDMKQYAQLSQAHAEDMQKLVTAFEPLYNSFSADQKTLADKTFRHGQPPAGKGAAHPKHKSKPKAAPASDAAAASAPAAQ
ncbi:Spy/CpxP family protein refolding chaperone [Paraburkholderia ferrariae]|uniref:Spy/CpxP family protein refolding chaperone n=1 Tax=Paraburkholderia ferrariae TaxID=386056 RepID=UPI000482AAD2|nr:Spy/CpxP family protein refolding chaperone [Paraburkholderia ferrariae]